MAIKALTWMIKAFDPPVYCYHEIIHNQKVVKRFEDAGVVFVDDIAEVPPGAPIMLSAHGSAPEVVQAARDRGGYVVDAVCPLVTKVHHEVKTRAAQGLPDRVRRPRGSRGGGGDDGRRPRGHSPGGQRQERCRPAPSSRNRWPSSPRPPSRTASGRACWSTLGGDSPDLWQPSISDLCFATTNRQTAMMEIAPECNAVLVIGSANSSNTQSLVDLAAEAGARRVLRINDADDVPSDLEGTIGVTAGASAPEDLVWGVIEKLAPRSGRPGGGRHRRGRVLPAPAQPS